MYLAGMLCTLTCSHHVFTAARIAHALSRAGQGSLGRIGGGPEKDSETLLVILYTPKILNNLQLRNEPPNAKCASCVCVCVCVCVSLGNSSKQSVLENAKQKCECECEWESDCECERGILKRATQSADERKCWQKVVRNRQRKHWIQMKLKLELELELESSVAMKMELKPSAETD